MSDVKYTNRYWETNVENNYGYPVFELHFTEFYEDKEILRFIQDKDNEELYHYFSEFLNVEDDNITAENVDDAIEQFEEMIIEYIEEEISDLKGRLSRFKEEE